MQITYGTISKDPLSPEEILSTLLIQRNITDLNKFIQPDDPTSFSLTKLGYSKELKVLLTLLTKIKIKKETVVIYTDYDTDGITGGAIMWETLHHLGFIVYPYVPHRHKEGYGFSIKGIDNVIEKYHPSLIISVDHGISAHDQIAYAVRKGVDVVVTDHHTKPELLPTDAKALIHTPLVSGASLSYITALDIWRHFDPDNKELSQLFHEDLLALAALGTIADLVPLVGYARSIAKAGLKAFASAKNPGIKELLKIAGLSQTALSPYHAGFALAPRINAVGRLSHAIEALRMLCTRDPLKATYLASQANMYNLTRQKMVEKAVEEAFLLVNRERIPPIVIVKNSAWNEGIIGLISSKLTEKFNRPSIVLTKNENNWKGSARSIKGFDITAFLRSLRILKHIGGHPQAAGFSFGEEELNTFVSLVEEKSKNVPHLEKTIYVDLKLPLPSFTEKVVHILEQMEPFGIGNPTPLFASDVIIKETRTIGKIGKHLKLFVSDNDKPPIFECVYFAPPEEVRELIQKNKKITIIFSLEINIWNGTKKIQGKIKTIAKID